jgi:hypothetical protein
MSCRHQWAGAIIKGPVHHILVDQCEKCGKLRLQDAAPPAQGIDLGQLQRYEPAAWRDTVTGKIESDMIVSKDGNWVKVKFVLALIDQRDAAPGVGNG